MINTQRLIQTFQTIVAIDSPTDEEEQMADFLMTFFQNKNYEPQKDEHHNVFVKIAGAGSQASAKPLFFNAHIDTVEPGRGIECIIDGDTLRSKGETILGSDNKAAVAAILEMIEGLEENNLDHPPLELLFTTSEEVANLGAINFDYTPVTATHGYSFDSGEDPGNIIIASPFYNRFDITLIGKSAHAARPHHGINALLMFNKAFAKCSFGKISENTVCNIGKIEGGHVRNTVPGSVTFNGEVRSFVETELEEVTNHITSTFSQMASSFGGQIEVDVVQENAGFDYDASDDFVQHVASHIGKLGKTPQFLRASGCYDANIFAEKGIKVLNMANGSRDSHSTNEHITIDDLTYTAELALSLAQVPFSSQ